MQARSASRRFCRARKETRGIFNPGVKSSGWIVPRTRKKRKGDGDVHHRSLRSRPRVPCAGFCGMRGMRATPPMGSKMTSGVSIPKRRAMMIWPNS